MASDGILVIADNNPNALGGLALIGLVTYIVVNIATIITQRRRMKKLEEIRRLIEENYR